MIELKKITTKDSDYELMQKLMITSFPIEERRDINMQKSYTDNNPIFYCNIITQEDKFIGFINYWNLEEAYYIEHFAIDSSLRGKGYGKLILKQIKEKLNDKPIILEVEPPLDEISNRRIKFYKNNGFILSNKKYIQPPYRKGGDTIELKLMYCENQPINDYTFEKIIDSIHNEVYGTNV